MVDPTDSSAGEWLAAAAPTLAAAESTAAGLAIAFVALYVGLASGTKSPAGDVVASEFLTPRGVSLEELLMRPVIEFRSGLDAKKRYLDAVGAGRAAAKRIGATDPMLSYRAASSEAMQHNPRVHGFRRVPDAKACKFCLLVSTQRYHDSDLMPLHPNCGCTIAPIVGTIDPGRVLDRELLEQLRSEGVLDDINRQRRAQAEKEINGTIEKHRAKAEHWRTEADTATDPVKKKRFSERAAGWDRKANQLEGTLPPANLEVGQTLIDEIFSKPSNFATVHQHGELGPTLYDPGHHFEAA